MEQVTGRFKQWQGWAGLVQQKTGKNWLRQVQEIHELRGAGGCCGATDYYRYRLYDEKYLKMRGARDFLASYMNQIFSESLNPRKVTYPAWDKLVFTLIADAAGVPIVPIKAYFHSVKHRSPALGVHLPDRDAVVRFLRDRSNYPLFGKPSFSQGGLGGAHLCDYDSASDSITMLDGSVVALNDFVRPITETPVHKSYHRLESGYLFQVPLVAAREIQTLTNRPTVCSVRITCLNGPEGMTPIRAIWKVAMAPNCMDNYGLGRYGNLLGDVDLRTGEVSRMLQGLWPTAVEFHEHPVTKLPFTGFCVPHWDRLLEVCKLGGAVFPLMRVHHWDIALTDEGPLALELNDLGGANILQMHGTGLLSEETREFLKRYGNADEYAWIKKL